MSNPSDRDNTTTPETAPQTLAETLNPPEPLDASPIRRLTPDEQTLCTAVLPLIARLSRTMARRNRSIGREDLEAVGHEAIVMAVLRFDSTIGPFERYALYFARGEMLNHVRKTLKTRERERRLPLGLIADHSVDERSPSDTLADPLERTIELEREEIVSEMRARIAGCLFELNQFGREHDSEEAHLAWRAMALGHKVLDETARAEPIMTRRSCCVHVERVEARPTDPKSARIGPVLGRSSLIDPVRSAELRVHVGGTMHARSTSCSYAIPWALWFSALPG